MEISEGDAFAAAAAAGDASSVDAGGEEPRRAIEREHSASAERAAHDSASDEEEPHDGEPAAGDADVEHLPRANLSQDAIAQLRAQRKHLKREQKRVRQEMKNTTRKRHRVMARVRHLDTASVLQVLVERGVQLGAPAAAPPAPAPQPAVAERVAPPAPALTPRRRAAASSAGSR